MKYKKSILILVSLFLIYPLVARADDNLEDIKEIRGDKNYYQDLMLDNVNMYIDISQFEKNGVDPKELGVNVSSSNKIYIDANNKRDEKIPEIIKELNQKSFTFMSGTGAWSTDLEFLDNKGNFKVKYTDADSDRTYIAEAKGKFSFDKKVNETCYILNLENFKVTSPTGEEERKGDLLIEYYKMPHGMESKDENKESKKFTLYLPKRKRSEMSDDVNDWINKRGDLKYINDKETRVFILVNNDSVFPFIENVD